MTKINTPLSTNEKIYIQRAISAKIHTRTETLNNLADEMKRITNNLDAGHPLQRSYFEKRKRLQQIQWQGDQIYKQSNNILFDVPEPTPTKVIALTREVKKWTERADEVIEKIRCGTSLNISR